MNNTIDELSSRKHNSKQSLAFRQSSVSLALHSSLVTMPKTRRISYDAAFKLKAVDLAIQYNSNRKAAFELGLNESMVRKWRKQREQLSGCKKSIKAFRGKQARWPELEKDLEDWVNVQRADGRGVSTIQIRLKAKEMAVAKKIEGFTGCASWCFRFMKRRNLTIRMKTTMCQQLPADFEEKIVNFRNYISEVISEHSVDHDRIINMDEVPLTFDMPLTRTVNSKGEKSVNLQFRGGSCLLPVFMRFNAFIAQIQLYALNTIIFTLIHTYSSLCALELTHNLMPK